MTIQIQHPRIADLSATLSGASFVTAHWFLTADHIVHFGAALFSMITGAAATTYYTKGAFAWIRAHLRRTK